MPSSSRWLRLVLFGGGLAACAGATDELAGQPGLLADVKGYYDRYAMEEGGLCGTPELRLATGSTVEERATDRLVVRVSYAYSDPNAKHLGECRGFGSRRFTVAKGADGFDVVEMTGEQHRGIRINKIDASKVW